MSKSPKVDSWLQNGKGKKQAEVYESDSDDSESVSSSSSSSSSSGSSRPAVAKPKTATLHQDESEDEEDLEDQVEEQVEWETLMPRLRKMVMDKSPKRRREMTARNLKITETEPPAELVPAVMTIYLSCLSLVDYPSHIDFIVQTLMCLVKRDQSNASEGSSKLQLFDKLCRWTHAEVAKILSAKVNVAPTFVLPYLVLLLALLDNLNASSDTSKPSSKSPFFKSLILDLACVLDLLEAQTNETKSADRRVRDKARHRVLAIIDKMQSDLGKVVQLLVGKSEAEPQRSCALLGIVIHVALHPLGQTKTDKGGNSAAVIENSKDEIMTFYTSNVLSSKNPVPKHRTLAFSEFFSKYLDLKQMKDKLWPIAERMLLRSPEVSLPVLAELVTGISFDISSLLPGKLLGSILSASKSSNADTRSKSVECFQAIISKCSDETTRKAIVTEVLALPKTGKTASAEHRVAIFQIVKVVPASDSSSSMVIETISGLLSKETSEPALQAICAALIPHLKYMLQSSNTTAPTTISALSKELNSSKVMIRRNLSAAIGEAVWSITSNRPLSKEGTDLIAAFATPLETNLRSAVNNAPANLDGFLEGYVSAALALGPLAKVKEASKLTASSALDDLWISSPKPSYVLNDKIYSKLSSSTDLLWLSRCVESMLASKSHKSDAISTSATVAALLYLALELTDSVVRRAALASISRLIGQDVPLIGTNLAAGLQSWLTEQSDDLVSRKVTSIDDEDSVTPKSGWVGRLLDAVFSSDMSPGKTSREELCVSFLIVAHHPEIGEAAQVSWVGLVQRIGVDPALIAVEQWDKILTSIWESAATPAKDAHMAHAAYRAAATLSFLCPEIYVDSLFAKIQSDLDVHSLAFIGPEELGIWETPAGQLFVDVLSNKKDVTENKNRKDYATDQWEREVRQSLAKKKTSTTGTLSKVDKAAVDAQMKKEAHIRAKVLVVQAQLQRGIELIGALVASNTEAMRKHVRDMAQLLLSSAFGPGSFLVDSRAFEVFLQLGSLAADRLGEYRRMLAGAALRAYETTLVPDDYLHENLRDLVTRLLHQLRFLSDQSPLDSATFAMCSLLFERVVQIGGVGTESPNSDEAQEQLTLVVNIIASSCGEFEDDTYPRLPTVRQLVSVIQNHPKLARDASSALVDLAAAIKDVATPEEIKEMISGTLSKDSNVRNAALQALQPVDLTDLDYSEELCIAVHDEDEQNASLALHLWEDNGLDIPETYLESLLLYLAHESPAVRDSCASALADALKQFPTQVEPSIRALQDLYVDKAKILVPEYDRFGMIIPETVNRPDPFECRVAIASTLERMSPQTPKHLIAPLFDFFINREALGDRHAEVRKAMLTAATSIVDEHGGEELGRLMKMFESYLGRPSSNSETGDYIQEAVVILFGRLARHLDSQDPRIPQVVDRLVEALNTPSELVQSAVADCLPPLVQSMGDEVEYLVDKLFSTLTTGAKYAGRRGAAYGLAGVIKGRGLSALKEYDLMEKLTEAAEDKGAYQSRQGAVFAFETLSTTLGKSFEPYIVSIIPLLLSLFGDGNGDVREATQDASRVIMSRISGHCVKVMLPTLLGGLEEKQWRTKKGSIELLGAMAFCAPRQLSLSLPTIIPQLTGVINDSHAQVKSAANTSLKRFGEVLSNPEIKGILNTLMRALADPAGKTNAALSAMLKTSFEHYLDAPSLALVMPIVDRGLRQRSSDMKRRAVQIVGNMASLTESRDLVPYLNELMPLVHEVLVDPVPEARATAAKSLGTLVERLGEVNFPTLVAQLLQTLRSDTSGVDRQGAAQGLSEVLSGLGMDRLEGLLPEIITNTSSPRPYVREGFISLLVYLPTTFGHRFAPHLGKIIQPILNGLADDSEYVREASMRAGKMIIANYSGKAIDLLLPELEKGMLEPSWRIRQSSISLTGELLYRVTGISGKVELEEEDAAVQTLESAKTALLEALGPERRDRVLATLYIVRQDAVSMVRQASIHIWKALVQNTPRTTREILPVLMQIVMSLLGSPEVEQQETASRTLGELCRKNGERIFGEIIPILQKAITSPEERAKEGACLAFADVMAASNKDVIHDYEDSIISAIRSALVDPSPAVRAAAAQTFDSMQHYIGTKAIDQTIPTLLEAMREPGEGSETALKALQEVMSVRANTVFPVLVPTLIKQPITAFNARALGALARVAGSALNRRLDAILGALVKSIEMESSESKLVELNGAVEAIIASVEDEEGIHQLQMLLLGWARDPSEVRRASACRLLATLCSVNQGDMSDYRVDWIRNLISLFNDGSETVVTAAWEALESFVKTVPQKELQDLVVPLRRAIESVGSKDLKVPGFSRPKGAQSIVPILLAGVLSGNQEQKEQAALGIGDLVVRTTEAAIKPYIIQMTGPLIRVISGQNISPQIKSAILLSLTTLLEEIPLLVKPFHPQLTRTFVKCLSEPSISVRGRAVAGLTELMKHQTRVDPLINELVQAARSSDDDVATSMVSALVGVCTSAGKLIGDDARHGIVDLAEDAFMESRGENYSMAIGRCLGALAKVNPETIRSIIDTFLAPPTPPIPLVSITIQSVLEQAPDAFFDTDVTADIVSKVNASVSSETSAIARPARGAREIMRAQKRWAEDKEVQAALR